MNSFLEKILLFIAIVSLVIYVFIVALDVFARNVDFVDAILWGQEIAMMAFVWSVFSGGAVAYRRREHFKIEVLPLNLRENIFIKIIVLILALFFSYILLKEGITLAVKIGMQRGSRPTGIPLIWVFLSIPLAGLSMILFTVERFIDMFFNRTTKNSLPVKRLNKI